VYASAVFVDSDIATFSPTCVFLDYMLLGEKVELGEEQVTILPETYNKQQAQLTVVLGKLVVPRLASYKSIFHSLDQNEATVYEEVHV
jgi:hypothetical protein